MSRGVMGIRAMGGPVKGVSQLLAMRNGLSIPSLGFGTYRLAETDVDGALSLAIECGFRHIDCAKIYLNEAAIGKTLQRVVHSRAVKRDELFLTSKLWPTDQHPENVEKAVRATLADLRTDYLDLLLIHWPVAWKHTGKFDNEVDRRPQSDDGRALIDTSVTLEDTWKAMTRLVDAQLVKSIGVSNCTSEHVNRLLSCSSLPQHAPVLNQIEYHPSCFQSELRSANGTAGLLTAAYCPLGMPTRFTPPEFTGVVNDTHIMGPLATNTGFSPARVLLNWNLDNGNVVIVKATSAEHIRDNAKACRYALSDSVRWVLNHVEDQFDKSVRVINPIGFSGEATPFFPPRGTKRKEYKP